MILLDTHVLVWWTAQSERLVHPVRQAVETARQDGLAVSSITLWEVAKLVELGRLVLDRPVQDWLDTAIAQASIRVVGIDVSIAVESTRLPAPFHKDPADQLIVATARVLDMPLVTQDAKIRAYPHVRLAS